MQFVIKFVRFVHIDKITMLQIINAQVDNILLNRMQLIGLLQQM